MYVCADCIEDHALQEVVREHAISEHCDYCNRIAEEPIACELSDVIDRVRWAIEQEYGDANNEELPWDEGFCGDYILGPEILWETDLTLENDRLASDIANAFIDDVFCKRDYYAPSEEEVFSAAWKRFRDAVQHQRRYTFWSLEDKGDDYHDPAYGITAAGLLKLLGGNIEHLSPIRTLPIGTPLYRVREYNKNDPKRKPPKKKLAKDYTSPPIEKALQANRMSPAGISMFYGASDFETAYDETVGHSRATGKVAYGAEFSTLIPLRVLDLTAIPRPDSYFSFDWDRAKLQARSFLEAFAAMLSKPIKRDKKYHIEYVPTQVFTEYIRYEWKTDGEPIQGIKYNSSQRKGGICYVIFAGQDECLPGAADRPKPQLLGCVPRSIRIIPKPKRKKP